MNVLVINSSASSEGSVSKLLAEEAVRRLQTQEADVTIVTRDLGLDPIPHLTPDGAAGLRTPTPANDGQAAAQALSNALIDELQAADTLVLGVPMYNFGIPSTLKTWFDYVLRAGSTFRYSEAGFEGLVKGKRAIVMLARGGFYSDGPLKVFDSQEPHLRAMLGFIGISDVTFVRAERLAFGPEMREQAIGAAQAEVATWAGGVAQAA